MKKLSIILVIITLVFVSPVFSEDNEDKKVDAKIFVGVKAAGKDGSMVKAKEYEAMDDGAGLALKAKIKGQSGSTHFSLYSLVKGSFDDSFHALSADFNRVLKQKFTYNSIYHRLDHDPLTNMDVVSHARSATYADDFNPADQYHITRSEFTSSTELTVPQLPFLKLYVDFRSENRKGMYQARTLSKCSSCHITAKSRSIDNSNRDIRIGGIVRLGKNSIDYSYTNNQFKENEAAPTNNYLKVLHPEKVIPVFDSRIGIGNNETLPFDVVPESKKNTHLMKAAFPVSNTSTITAQYVNANVENVATGLNWKSNSFAGGFSTLLGKKGFFNIRFRQYKIENDSIFVDIVEPLDVAGPNAGMTYAERYDGVFDFTRYSAMNRTVLDVDANLRYRLSKAFRLRVGYEYKSIERDYTDVEKTTSSTIKGRLTIKPSNQFNIVFNGKFKSISDPFANVRAGAAPSLQTTAYTNPFVGTQFFMWHEERLATMTNQAESVSEIKARIHWGPSSKFAVNGNFLVRSEENDSLDYVGAAWKRDMTQWGVDMWAAITEKFPVTIAYYNYTNNYESLFSIPAIEGCGAGFVGGMTGSLTDMMGYDTETQTLLVNLHYWAGKKLGIFCNFNYNNSKSMIVDLALNEGQLAYLPGSGGTALDFDNMGEVAEYSELEMKQMIAELGFKYAFTKKWAMNASFYYYFYDDLTDYLFTDTTGKSYSFYAGITWSN